MPVRSTFKTANNVANVKVQVKAKEISNLIPVGFVSVNVSGISNFKTGKPGKFLSR